MKKDIFVIALAITAILLSGCVQPPVCGNGLCEQGENHDNCSQDCASLMTCSAIGGKTCLENELCSTYTLPAKDSNFCCIAGECTKNNCGNGICNVEQGENSQNCPQDCPTTETHFECQNQACIEVQGEGADQCSVDADCQAPPVSIGDNFEKIFQGSSNGKKIKLFFINYGYPENNYDAFDFDVNYTLFADDDFEGFKYKGFLKAEPYKTYKEHFDIYQINRLLNETDLSCSISDPEKPCKLLSILSFAKSHSGLNIGQCNLAENQNPLVNCNIMVIFIKDSKKLSVNPGAVAGAAGYYIYLIPHDYEPGEGIKKQFVTFLHEAGHLFGDILDEYFTGYAQWRDYSNLDDYTTLFEGKNCDIRPGCPSWCTGEAKTINRNDPCMNIQTEEACNSSGKIWGSDICMWMTNQEIAGFFGSNCIPSVARGEAFSYNSGNLCEEGLGCYYGCNSLGWRSTKTSLYVGWIEGTGQEWNTYSKDGLEPYNKIQKEMIIKKIENAINTNAEVYIPGIGEYNNSQ